jgi:2-aminobenzoate-CoA ligase
MNSTSAHQDSFARDNLPPPELLPQFLFTLDALRFPDRLNCAAEILGRQLALGRGSSIALRGPDRDWTYAELDAQSNRVADVLARELGVVPGQRVLLRAPNSPWLAACWFGVIKAGAIAVTTMPLLRARDLAPIVRKARINAALCDERLLAELEQVAADAEPFRIVSMNGTRADGGGELARLLQRAVPGFTAVPTASDDVALIAFTSGTTGEPKGTLHFHRDVIAMCVAVADELLALDTDEIVIGSPPLGFTFGLGSLLTFPLWRGASAVLLESARPDELLAGIERFRATFTATAPTAYRAMLKNAGQHDLSSLRTCMSAGEHLPVETFHHWREATGIAIFNGLGTTEMTHMFIGAVGRRIRPGSTGTALPGYEVVVLDSAGQPAAPGAEGRLAARGPTGCKYLADPRQRDYVLDGWNLTGDICSMDEDGYVWYRGRSDDMIISAGYNIAGMEVEQALLGHPAVQECAVIGAPDAERGQVVKAFVVAAPGHPPGAALSRALQEFVKEGIAPYKYPRLVEFVDSLPKTHTGKLQRAELRKREQAGKTAG